MTKYIFVTGGVVSGYDLVVVRTHGAELRMKIR